MCDIIVKENLTKEEIPKYVYKRVQKVGNGKYVTPVMGEPLYKGSWKGAKSHEMPDDSWQPLVRSLKTKYQTSLWPPSSTWSEHHIGKWTSFKYVSDAINADLISNFENDTKKFPTVIVKCEIRGDIHSSIYEDYRKKHSTFLATQIRVVEEVG